MGGAASTESDKGELRAAFAEYTASSDAAARAAMLPEAFEALVLRHAPTLHAKFEAAGSDGGGGSGGGSGGGQAAGAGAACAALRDQFDGAAAKLGVGSGGGGGGSGGGGARAAVAAAAAAAEVSVASAERSLHARHGWAAGVPAGLQRGLIAGLLRTAPLRTVRLAIGPGTSPGGGAAPFFAAAAAAAAAAASEEPEAAAAASSSSGSGSFGPLGLSVGQECAVEGLVSKPEANGSLVVVEAWDAAKAR
jgi:hypothetical protein